MGRHSNTTGHLERSAEDHVLRRAIAARLDRALQQAGTSSAKAAKWLSVTQEEVDFWRRGITGPLRNSQNLYQIDIRSGSSLIRQLTASPSQAGPHELLQGRLSRQRGLRSCSPALSFGVA